MPVLPNTTDHFDMYKNAAVPVPDLPATGQKRSIYCVHATPAVSDCYIHKHGPAHFGTVLVWIKSKMSNVHTKDTNLEGKHVYHHLS